MVIANVIYKSPFDGKTKCVSLETDRNHTIEQLYDYIACEEKVPSNCFRLYLNGKCMRTTDDIPYDAFVTIHLPLIGGKGGFGSMLRAIGAQIEKTTNREACRDLSGRRLRDINEEKRLKDWIAKQAKRKEENERKRREKLERMTREPKYEFNDPEYHRIRSDLTETIDNAVQYGLSQSTSSDGSGTSGVKRKLEDNSGETGVKIKKHSMWLGIDYDIDDTDDDSSEDDHQISASVSGEQKDKELEKSCADNDVDRDESLEDEVASN